MTISTIIPCYNVAEYIEACLDSVYSQSLSPGEVIAVDNNSTDATLKILQAYKEKKQSSLIILQEGKKGAPAARNKGLQQAQGDWIQFLDADDLLEPNKLKHQMNLLEKTDNEVAFVAAASKKKKLDGRILENTIPEQDPFLNLFLGKLGNTCANLWKREAVLQAGGWSENQRSSQEPDLMFRLLKNDGKVRVDNDPHTLIRERPSGQISDQSLDSKIRFMDLRFQMLEYFKEKQPGFYQKHYHQLWNKIYEVTLMISSYDVEQGYAYYQKLPRDFTPTSLVKGKVYKTLLGFVGFKRLMRFTRFILPKTN
ncbi:MAG: glycosyltransferase family 2 protein [Bacteroidetes bacterium]|nr:glycosyltransferase family 2 protein [Bacteroidota bacterium]